MAPAAAIATLALLPGGPSAVAAWNDPAEAAAVLVSDLTLAADAVSGAAAVDVAKPVNLPVAS
jgi:hypothetical protein